MLVALAAFAADLTCAGAGNADQDVRSGPSSSQQAGKPIRSAEWLGLDAAMSRRGSSCISNDLRPECQGKQGSAPEPGLVYIEWDSWTNRCFITANRPIGRIIKGGGPYQSMAAARAAISTIKGC